MKFQPGTRVIHHPTGQTLTVSRYSAVDQGAAPPTTFFTKESAEKKRGFYGPWDEDNFDPAESPLHAAMTAAEEPMQDLKAEPARNPILASRETTHGSFSNTAKISQELKNLIAASEKDLPPVMLESLDMIAVKIARILSGNARDLDHWKDIAGYAELIVEYLGDE